MSAKAQKISCGSFHTSPSSLIRDAFGGVITALVSIPISMGYAQIAGLPMKYGLYGSIVPILLFGLITGSKDFVFGVDAAPAALIGTAIASMGITAGSAEAAGTVPLIALFSSCWLLLFYFLKAGKIVQYISEPVMGGFISGICCTIILMQIPKLFGGNAGHGEAPELIIHIVEQTDSFNLCSLGLGLGVIFIITLFRHIAPKIPVSVIIMAAGAASTMLFPLTDVGVRLLPSIESGFPEFGFSVPSLNTDTFSELMFASLSVAAVILAESLLASKGNAQKDGYTLNPNREILAYSAANFASALSGCCSVNGSVSRTGIVRQFGVRSQWMSVFASLTMLAIVCFFTGFIAFLPVPVLTAIVISALMGACEFKMAVRLFRTDKRELIIFLAAFFGVLVFGTVYGVMIGVALSFFAVIVRAVTPPRDFLGVIPGREGFYPLGRSRLARPVKHTLIYRFGGNIFFANADTLSDNIFNSLKSDTGIVIIHAGAVSSIDIAAAERLKMIYHNLKEKNIRFYITEHIGAVNDMLRKYGASELIENGAVRMTVQLALRDASVSLPYPVEEGGDDSPYPFKGMQAELEWALGDDAEAFKSQLTEEIYLRLKNTKKLTVRDVEELEGLTRWGRFNLFDEDELLDRLEARMLNRAVRHPDQAERIESMLEERREMVEKRMAEIDPEARERIRQHRIETARSLLQSSPEEFEAQRVKRLQHIEALKRINPELAEHYYEIYRDVLEIREEQ